MTPTEAEIAWAAGLFEGEGSFSTDRGKTITLALGMTDQDIVDRFHEIVGVGNRYVRERPAATHKTQFIWQISAIDDVRLVVSMFLPYFGRRRRARAIEVLDAYNTADVARRSKERCPSGHLYDAENTRIDQETGHRFCRACRAAYDRDLRTRKKELVPHG